MPARLAGALRRALALAPGQRWADAPSFAQGLASPSGAMRGAGIAAVAALLARSAWRLLQPPATDPWGPGDATPGTPTGRRAWQQAEGLYAAGRWREADDAFARVIAADSSCLVCRLPRLELDRWLEQDRDSADVRIVAESVGQFAQPWQWLVRSLTAPAVDRRALLEETFLISAWVIRTWSRRPSSPNFCRGRSTRKTGRDGMAICPMPVILKPGRRWQAICRVSIRFP